LFQKNRIGTTNYRFGKEQSQSARTLAELDLEANTLENEVLNNNWREIKSFLQQIGSNRRLRAQTLIVFFKKPFDLLAEINFTLRNTSELFERCLKWWSLRDSNP
jgi:hypothetical protein